jgi:hypothetical protein
VLREIRTSQTNSLEWPVDGFLGYERRRELILDALREAVKQAKATLKET